MPARRLAPVLALVESSDKENTMDEPTTAEALRDLLAARAPAQTFSNRPDLLPGEHWPSEPGGTFAYLLRRIDALEHFVRCGLNAGQHLDADYAERLLRAEAGS
jgi:hypothetical protein